MDLVSLLLEGVRVLRREHRAEVGGRGAEHRLVHVENAVQRVLREQLQVRECARIEKLH